VDHPCAVLEPGQRAAASSRAYQPGSGPAERTGFLTVRPGRRGPAEVGRVGEGGHKKTGGEESRKRGDWIVMDIEWEGG